MTSSTNNLSSPAISPSGVPSRVRLRTGLSMAAAGFLVSLLGARPDLFDLDRSPVIGFVQIAVFLIGLATICLGGYTGLMAFWRNGSRTIAADIGSRLVATGYVVAVFAGMADVFGFGTQAFPRVPFFGPWQSMGVQVGEAVIAVGFLLLIPFRRKPAEE
jgi:hypothetical protein